LLPEDVRALSELVRCRDLHEQEKPNHKEKIAGRVRLLHEVIARGINALLEAEGANRNAADDVGDMDGSPD